MERRISKALIICFFLLANAGTSIALLGQYAAGDTITVSAEGEITPLTIQTENGPLDIAIKVEEPPGILDETGVWILISVIAVAIIYFAFRFFLNRSRKNAVLEAKLAHLERSALQAQMNPHFIFNSLNSIQSYIANEENEKANRFLAKFSRLVRSMLNHARSQKITLEEEIESLRLYMELEKMRFKDKFDFDIVIDEDIDPTDIILPPLLIQPYLENAIIHGLAQTRSQGQIRLYYIMDGKYLLATVTDNGIGYETSKRLKQQQGVKTLHKSVGMTITQKRLEMLDEGNTDKKVTIQEVKDRQGEVLGTKVDVKIRVS
ncbi:sensor histidine kinase [Sanyastnella coralliicola]|uniref:sensor histidine kinase n=1 Tax=Sanyastnella coralliicola TaxID=3069118 RepID=UPI0027B9133D|nr:histidine kinase [Longitalea sp. SCSIO 12813]